MNKRMCRHITLFVSILFSLFFIACASAESAQSPRSKHSSETVSEKKTTSDEATERKDNRIEDSDTETEGHTEKAEVEINDTSGVRKMSKEEQEEREARFDGTKYIGPALKEFEKGLEYYFKTDCVRAIERWNNGLNKDRFAAPIAFNIALCYARTGDATAAEKWYKKSFDMDNDYARPLYNLFLLKKKAGAVRVDEFKRLATKIPTDVTRYNFLAWVYYQMGQYDSAEATAKKTLKIDEQNVDAVVVLASIYLKKKMLSLAEMALETAEKWDKNDFRVERLLGFVYYMQKREGIAQTHLQNARRLNPELPAVLNLLAELAMKTEDWDGARQNLEFLLAFTPDFLSAKLNLAVVYKKQQEYKKSLQLLQELEKADSDSETRFKVLYNLGVFYLETDINKSENPERFDTAKAYFKRALALLKKKRGRSYRKKRKLVAEYVKECELEKKKLIVYLKVKKRREQRKKEAEEEARKYAELRAKKFEEAKQTNTLDVWREFVKKFPPDDPDNPDDIAKEATKRLAEFEQKEKERAEWLAQRKAAFDAAKKIDSVVVWQKFLRDFPSVNAAEKDEMTQTALSRIAALKKAVEERQKTIAQYQKDRSAAFEKVKAQESIAAWEKFIKQYPPVEDGKEDHMSRFAKERVTVLREQKMRQKQAEAEYRKQRKEAFALAKQVNRIDAWQDFVSRFPPHGVKKDMMTYYASLQIKKLKQAVEARKLAQRMAERKRAFDAVKRIDNYSVFQKFSDDFSDITVNDAISKYVAKRMDFLQTREKIFEVIKKADRLDGYKKFLRDFPLVSGAEDDDIARYVKKRIKELEQKK